jgi:hypothetical protein
MKGKALRRALTTSHVDRITDDIPLIVDQTEIITPERAYELLAKNDNNRPVNWKKVEEYAAIMKAGGWKLHAQGIILDSDGNVLTGQKRLWAVIHANVAVRMRVSRGSPKDTASLIDRGASQSARDLASRDTGRKHSPIESSIVRAILAARGRHRPSADEIAQVMSERSKELAAVLAASARIKKTRVVLMLLGAIVIGDFLDEYRVELVARVSVLSIALADALAPQSVEQCWGKGAAFGLAMLHAIRLVRDERL